MQDHARLTTDCTRHPLPECLTAESVTLARIVFHHNWRVDVSLLTRFSVR